MNIQRVGLVLTLSLLAAPAAAQSPGDVVSLNKISATSGGFAGDLDAVDHFGAAVAPLGDLDGDGHADLAVGARYDDDGDPAAGAVWILFLDAAHDVLTHTKISDTSGGFTGGLGAFDQFGGAVAALGDVDGDGVTDLAVGASRDDDDGPQSGAVWVLFLNADGTVKAHSKIAAGTGGFGGPLTLFDRFGSSVAGLGDLDRDGVPDLAVGAPGDLQGGFLAGAVWVLLLNADGSVKAHQKITENSGGFGGSLAALAAFGASVAALDDLDGDGSPELAVGATGGAGLVWMLSLNADGTVGSESSLAEGVGGFAGDLDAGDQFGRAVADAGDLDGDGVHDLLVGAPGDDDGGSSAGAVWLLRLAPDATVVSALKYAASDAAFEGAVDDNDRLGLSLALLAPYADGDLCRIAAGADQTSDGGFLQGAVWTLDLQGPPPLTDEEQSSPFTTQPGSFEGVPGRPALVVVPLQGPGDDFIFVPVTVTPNSSGHGVRVSSPSTAGGGGGGGGDVVFSSPSDYSTGENPAQAATADYDDDGSEDVATANTSGGSVSLLKGAPTAGLSPGDEAALGFGAPVDFVLPNDSAPIALVSADFDQDTDPDIAVAGAAGVTILRNQDLFSGDFEEAEFEPVGYLTDLAVGDLNGDGRPDLVATSGALAGGPGVELGFATALLGAGDGTFTNAGAFATGKAVASVLLADVDHDTRLDALLAIHAFDAGPGNLPQGSLVTWRGNGAGGFVPSGKPWTLEGQATGVPGFHVPHPDGIHPRFGALSDLNSDGWLDAVYTSTDNIAFAAGTFGQEQPPVVVTVLLNNQLGGFDVREHGTAYTGRGVNPLLADFFTVPAEDGGPQPDCILVWHQDVEAGTGNPANVQTFLAALVGDGEGGLTDATPNQFLTGDVPGDPALGDFNNPAFEDGGAAPGHLDILVPNMVSNSLLLLLGDGEGGTEGQLEYPGVDEVDASSLPHAGLWVGGPRAAQTARLTDDDRADAIVYNLWEDQFGQFASVPSITIYRGEGAGLLTKTQYLPLPAPGDFAVADAQSDANADVVVTRRTNGVADALVVHSGEGHGLVEVTPTLYPVPAGHVLSGGLDVVDLDGDQDMDFVTTTLGPDGHVLVFVNQAGGGFTTVLSDLGADWTEVRSLDVGTVSGDVLPDVLIGGVDGRLYLAKGLGGGAFTPALTSPTAAAKGGGALRLGNLNGDGRMDLVSSARVVNGNQDQAFVRALLGSGTGAFKVDTMPGISSTGPMGALRPELGDMNDDGAIDVVLAHGDSNTVTVHLNPLSQFETYGPGVPGTAGVTPRLLGLGYTTPNGRVELRIDAALGGASALMQIGTGQAIHPFLAVDPVVTQFLFTLGGEPGEAAAGTWVAEAVIPDNPVLLGVHITLQAIVQDPANPGPAAGFSLTNGLMLTIVD